MAGTITASHHQLVKKIANVSERPGAAIQNLAKAKVNAFKDAFVQMNFGEELTSCLEIQVLNVIRIR